MLTECWRETPTVRMMVQAFLVKSDGPKAAAPGRKTPRGQEQMAALSDASQGLGVPRKVTNRG